tara:strand:- start:161 stop:553 length:393 start_codon:yes stop_codon:yes gene_type:complete
MENLSYTSSLIYEHTDTVDPDTNYKITGDGGTNVSGLALPSRFKFLGISIFWNPGTNTLNNSTAVQLHNGNVSDVFMVLSFENNNIDSFECGYSYILKDCSYLIENDLYFSALYTSVGTVNYPQFTVYYQ